MTGNSTVTAYFSPFSKGEMLSVFFHFMFFCLVRCLLSFFFLPFFSSQGRFLKKFSGANFCFLGGLVGLVFFLWVFAYVFALFFSGSLPKSV